MEKRRQTEWVDPMGSGSSPLSIKMTMETWSNSMTASFTSCRSSIGGDFSSYRFFSSYNFQFVCSFPFPLYGVWGKKKNWTQCPTQPNIPALCHATISFAHGLATVSGNRVLANGTQAETWKELSGWASSSPCPHLHSDKAVSRQVLRSQEAVEIYTVHSSNSSPRQLSVR